MSPDSIAQRFKNSHLADPEFAQLDWDLRELVNHRIDAVRTACGSAEAVGAAVREFGRLCGLPEGTARRVWDRIVKEGWRGALDGRKLRAVQNVATRKAFMDFWFELVEKHNRSVRSAWQDLLTLRKAGHIIPGYQDCGGHPAAGADGIPEGWSYKTLIKHKPAKTTLTLARLGRKAFSAQTTNLWTTREGMRCGQIFQFDDVLHDFSVALGKQMVRPMELGCIDLASTKRVLHGLCPQIKTESGKLGLKENYMTWLVINLLTEIGFQQDGCVLIVEHGTAAIREPFEKALHDITKGKITVERSGIQNKPALLGYWAGEGGGNPRIKATLESLQGYYHNRMGLLPAQAGSNSRLDQPEAHKAVLKYAAVLAKELDQCPPAMVEELYAKLQLPSLTFSQLNKILYEFYQVIDGRHEHNLEGWEKQGWIKTRWRLSENDGWHDEEDLAGLDECQLEVWRNMIQRKPELCRPMRMSPNEVWARRQGMRLLPQHTIPLLVGPQMGREITIQKHGIEFQDQEIDPDGLRFSGLAEDPFGHQVLLKKGEKYSAFLNPFRPERLLICDMYGRYVGSSARIERAARIDHQQVLAAIGKSAHEQTVQMQEYRDRHVGDVTAHQDMLEHNRLVLQGAKTLRRASDRPGRSELSDIFGPKQQPKEEPATDERSDDQGDGMSQIYGDKNDTERE